MSYSAVVHFEMVFVYRSPVLLMSLDLYLSLSFPVGGGGVCSSPDQLLKGPHASQLKSKKIDLFCFHTHCY